jgi:hypothetical protein
MDGKLLAEALYESPWQRAAIALSSGEVLTLRHVDSVLMPRNRAWLIVSVNKGGNEVPRLIDPGHVVSIETEPVRSKRTVP